MVSGAPTASAYYRIGSLRLEIGLQSASTAEVNWRNLGKYEYKNRTLTTLPATSSDELRGRVDA